MSECTDKHIGDKLYAYEIGMLGEQDQQEVELHLLECRFCNERACRFQKAANLIRHDGAIRETVARLDTESTARRRIRPGIIRSAFAAAAIIVLLLLKPWQLEFRPTQEAMAEENRLAVMYFDNLVDPEDSRHTGEIAANLLITDLSQSHYVQVVSSQRLYDIIRLFRRDDSAAVDKSIALKAAAKARARWILTGSILQLEPNLIVTTQLIDLSTGNVIASRRVTGEPDDNIFSLVDKLTVEIKSDLALPMAASQEPDAPVSQFTSHSPEAYLYYIEGVNYYNKVYRAEAARSLERALEYDSTCAMAFYYLANLKPQERDQLVSNAVRYSGRVGRIDSLYIAAMATATSGDTTGAMNILTDVINAYPDEKVAFLDLAIYEMSLGHTQKGIERLLQAIEIDPLFTNAINQLAYAYEQIGDIEKAFETANRYVEIAPDDANAYDTRADIMSGHGRLDDAIQSYERVREIKPDFDGYISVMVLGRLYTYRGDYEKAAECFQETAIHGERFVRSMARTYLGTIPMYRGRLREALSVLDDAIAADRMEQATAGNYGARSYKHFIRALIYADLGKRDSTDFEMQEAIRVHHLVFPSDRPAFRCMRAQLLAEGGDLQAAEKVRDMLFEEYQRGLGPAQSAYPYAAGSIALARGETREAVAFFQDAVRAADFYDIKIMLARALFEDGRYDDAITEYNALLDDYQSPWHMLLSPWTVRGYYHLGVSYENTGDTQMAIANYKKFLNTWDDPDPALAAVVDDARQRLTRLENQL